MMSLYTQLGCQRIWIGPKDLSSSQSKNLGPSWKKAVIKDLNQVSSITYHKEACPAQETAHLLWVVIQSQQFIWMQMENYA